jgi:hypothetical protein
MRESEKEYRGRKRKMLRKDGPFSRTLSYSEGTNVAFN